MVRWRSIPRHFSQLGNTVQKFWSVVKSKTLWFATAVTSAGVVQMVTPFIPPQYLPVVLAATGIATAALRTVTTKPVTEK